MSEIQNKKTISITWDQYLWYIKALARLVRDLKDFQPNQVVCIATKGIPIGLGIADILGIRNRAIMGVRRYKGEVGARKDEPGKLEFSRELLRLTPEFGAYVLLVDDLTDEGETLKRSMQWLRERAGFVIDKIVTATIWCKKTSKFRPDVFVQELDIDLKTGKSPWIDQPNEVFERTSLEDLDVLDLGHLPIK